MSDTLHAIEKEGGELRDLADDLEHFGRASAREMRRHFSKPKIRANYSAVLRAQEEAG